MTSADPTPVYTGRAREWAAVHILLRVAAVVLFAIAYVVAANWVHADDKLGATLTYTVGGLLAVAADRLLPDRPVR